MHYATNKWTEETRPDLLTETLRTKLGNPERSSNFDTHGALSGVQQH